MIFFTEVRIRIFQTMFSSAIFRISRFFRHEMTFRFKGPADELYADVHARSSSAIVPPASAAAEPGN